LRRLALLGALALFGVAAAAAPARAQFGAFGQNKIQYRDFRWHVLRGEHVDLYFYPEEEELARVALANAEESYGELEIRFRHSVARRIPLIVYASHSDFEQTNVLWFVPPEGLLGITEFLKQRVALPFRGSYGEFRHTIRHELVHAFQLSKGALTASLYPRQHRAQMPLWWWEGLAEFWSGGEDASDEMVLRDLTVSGRLPTIEQLDGILSTAVYPIGGVLVRFLADRYGEWRLAQMYDDAWKYSDFTSLLEAVFGRTREQLSAEWQLAMRRRHFSSVERQEPLEISATRIAELAVKPAVWTPPGDSTPEVLYLSPASGYMNVYAAPLSGGSPRTVVEGERTAQFESFHAFQSRLDVSRRGVLAFTSQYQDRDALVLWDLQTRKLVGRYQFPDIVSILSPCWAPDGQSVVFSGLTLSGYSDLYLLDLRSGGVERITSDRYEDRDPSFSPDGTRLVFSSDRTALGADGSRNLFVMDLATRSTRYLTYGAWHDDSPRWEPESGRIVFTSDRRGVFDVYAVDSTGLGRRETAVPGGTFDAVWVASAGRYVLGGFEDLSFNVYSLPPGPDTSAADSVALGALQEPAAQWRWTELDDPRYARADAAQYERHYSLDFAAAEAVYTPGYAGAQGAVFLLTDMLGDNLLYVSMLAYQQASGIGDLINNFNGTAFYMNQSQRLNWGVGAFRVRGLFYDGDYERLYHETSLGGYLELRYPVSRFTRLQAQFRAERSDRIDFGYVDDEPGVGLPRRRGLLTAEYLSFVHDNSLWLPTGPIDGGRTNITAGLVSDLSNARFDSWVLSADLRRYVRTGLRTALAFRGYAYYSGGARPQRVSVGGSYALRGYPRYAYVTGNRAVMGNAEWRFPLTDFLSVGFPIGELRFPGVQGAFFVDLGRAWSQQLTGRGWLGAYGVGLRMNLGAPFVLRLDLGWRYAVGETGPYDLPIGFRGKRFADFWFGYNY